MVNDIHILNGRTGQDKEGGFTCVMPNGGKSTIDYIICSTSLFAFVKDFCIHYKETTLTGMSHFPLIVNLHCNSQIMICGNCVHDMPGSGKANTYVKIKWNKTFEQAFHANMNSNSTEKQWHEFDRLLECGNVGKCNNMFRDYIS